MTETPDRFMIEVGSGTVAHVINMGASESGTASSSRLDLSGTGEKMCSRG